MSTRSIIARAVGDGFRGRYHHWDGYPTGLGKALWGLHRGHFEGDLARMLRALIDDHPAGWSTIVDRDFSLTPGYIEYGHGPCTQCGCEAWEHYYQDWESHGRRLTTEAKESMAQDHYSALGHSYKQPEDRRPQCYCHGDRHEATDELTQQTAAGVGCEWAYVFDEIGRVMQVLGSFHKDGKKMIGMFGMGDPDSQWELAATVPLDGPDPDWGIIECGTNLERCPHYRCLHGAPGCNPDCPYCHGTGVAPVERRLTPYFGSPLS